MTNPGLQKLTQRMDAANSLVCVGLDSQLEKLPAHLKGHPYPQFAFNQAIIDATHEYVCAYKPNIAFYEAQGEKGLTELKMTMDYLRLNHPEVFTICDAKRGDIGSTNVGYVQEIFDWLGFNAVTLHPYLGREAIQPFLDRKDKVSIILCRTSNPGSPELQDLLVDGQPLWSVVAKKVAANWNGNQNCMLVVGATYPEEMSLVRQLVPEMTFLVPGIGAQGGDLQATVAAGLDAQKKGVVINSARAIIFASQKEDFAEMAGREAKKLRDQIQTFIEENSR